MCCEIYQLLVNLFCHEPNRGFSFKTECPEKVSFGHKHILENKDDVKPPSFTRLANSCGHALKTRIFLNQMKEEQILSQDEC